MKLGVFSVLLADMPFDKACQYLASQGVTHIEIGCGGHPGKAHCDPEILLNDKAKLDAFKGAIKDAGLTVSAFSCHGNPVHPNKDIAKTFHDDFMNALRIANECEIDRVIGFSGCPGDSENSLYPNWVTCPWPDDYPKILEWQWNEKLIPYWTDMAKTANEYGVKKIAFEMHPGFCVYNPETLLKLRAAVGDTIGANLDPSHFFWQGIDPVAAVKELKDAIYYVHAKDTAIDVDNTKKNGVLDTKHFGREAERSWIFRTVGYGHDMQWWRDFVSALRLVGYDDVLSIEHEDSLMTPKEGLEKAIKFLKDTIIFEGKTDMWWA